MEIKIEINGTEYRATASYSISQTAGAVSESSVDIDVPVGQQPPRTMAECVIYDGTTPLFRGLISNVSSPSFSSGYEVKRYRISVQSKECVFNNRLVSEAFEGKYTHEIIQALYDGYIIFEGIDLGAISESEQYYENYNCQFTKLSDVLTELAEDINASYYVSPDNKFYFITRDAFVQIDAPTHIKELQLEEETGDLRTVQIVTGATEKTTTQTENTYWTSGQTAMVLGYQVASVNGATVNGVTVGVGQLGVDEEDTSKTFLYQLGSNILTLNANASVKPAAGQNVVVVYQGYFEIVVTNTNDSLMGEISGLNGTSGRIEQVLTDETINNFADADAKASAMLAQYREREQTVSCVCHHLGLTDLYTMWDIERDDLNISGQYVITEREINSFGVDDVTISVKLKNRGYFARYGKVLNPGVKNATGTVKVYKTTLIGDVATTTDEIQSAALDLVYYPTSGAYADPMLDSFYPGV